MKIKFVQELTHGAVHSADKYARIKAAYDVLSDSTSRQEYDQQLGRTTEGSASSLQPDTRLTPAVDIIWSVMFAYHVVFDRNGCNNSSAYLKASCVLSRTNCKVIH